jgi:purine-nucleoside phosphorylase
MRPMKYEAVQQAKDYLLERIGAAPQFAIIMGSGLSAVDEILRDTTRIHYMTIPNFPVPKVAGHRGQVVFGKVASTTVIVFEGRVHYYEGNTMDEVSFCTRVIGSIGAKDLLLTNAAGMVNPSFARGQLMLITDHLNLLGANPLSGPNDERWGPRFLDQTQIYDADLRQALREAGQYCGLRLVEGVYAAVEGPTYETPAEARYLRAVGADAVGMSTVPEAIVARHMGMKVAGISMLANVAGGTSGKTIDHKEVLETATTMNGDVGMLLQRFFENYAK